MTIFIKKMHLELPSSFSLPPFAKFYFHLIWQKLKKILTNKTTNSMHLELPSSFDIPSRTLQKPTPIQNARLWNVEAPMCTQNQNLDSMQITKFQKLPMPCIHYLITHKIRSYNYDSQRPNANCSSLLFHESNKNSCVATNYTHVINLWTQN
jgi:hypothetical protein